MTFVATRINFNQSRSWLELDEIIKLTLQKYLLNCVVTRCINNGEILAFYMLKTWKLSL